MKMLTRAAKKSCPPPKTFLCPEFAPPPPFSLAWRRHCPKIVDQIADVPPRKYQEKVLQMAAQALAKSKDCAMKNHWYSFYKFE